MAGAEGALVVVRVVVEVVGAGEVVVVGGPTGHSDVRGKLVTYSIR